VIRAVVFDFDGVLANSEPLHFRAFRDVLAAEGLTLTEEAYYTRYLGYDDVGAFRAIAADSNRSLEEAQLTNWVAQKAERLEALERGASVLFPGAREAIARMARSGPIAIASGALREEIMRVLEQEQLTALFAAVVAAGDTPASKPDPAPYTRAVELLNTTRDAALLPSHCVAIEDSHWGLVSAKRAGLRTIAITHSYPANDLHEADLVIGHLDELTPQLLSTFKPW
jgi:HAD superfamily hydrolase (TIGR01509 family)